MSREAAEAIIRAEFPRDAPNFQADIVAGVLGNINDVDAEPEGIAHDLWAFGGGVEHDGCPYGGPEPEDAHYENACGVCKAHLLVVAERIAAEVTGSSDPSS